MSAFRITDAAQENGGTGGIEAQVSTAPQADPRPAMPDFKRRWYFSDDKLDIRPALWSMWNSPNEWDIKFDYGEWWVISHTKSTHRFHVTGRGMKLAYLTGHDDRGVCSCTGAEWQPFQKGALVKQARRLIRKSGIVAENALLGASIRRDEQFRGHFE